MAANHFGEHAIELPSRPPPPQHAGQKRQADDDLEANSGIATQFKKLRINRVPHRHPLLAAHHASVETPASSPELQPLPAATLHPLSNQHVPHAQPPPTLPSADFMPIDETSHRIVIHDLDAEIAAIEAEEPVQHTLFLPDIDKKVSAIPESVLNPHKDSNNINTQLVLYRDPISISVPEGEDAVRKAIIEARKRMREQQAKEREEARVEVQHIKPPVQTPPETRFLAHGYNHPYPGLPDEYEMDGSDHAPSHFYTVEDEEDPDAMDIG